MTRVTKFAALSAATALFLTAALAQQLSVEEQMAVKDKVQTAVALAEIAEAEGDGEALLVAGRLIASVGAVAKRGETDGDKPVLYSVADIAAAAKALGADNGRADALAMQSTADQAQPTYCYWQYVCGKFECSWVYNC